MRVGRFFAVFGSEKRYFRINNLHEHTCIISRTVMQILFQVFLAKRHLIYLTMPHTFYISLMVLSCPQIMSDISYVLLKCHSTLQTDNPILPQSIQHTLSLFLLVEIKTTLVKGYMCNTWRFSTRISGVKWLQFRLQRSFT